MDNQNNETSVPALKAEEVTSNTNKSQSFGHEILEQAHNLRKKICGLETDITFGDRYIEVVMTHDDHGVLKTLLQVKLNREMADARTGGGWNSTEHYLCSLMLDAAYYIEYGC